MFYSEFQSLFGDFQNINEYLRCRFLGITANEEYGGLGMGYQAHCVVMEEISRASGKNYPKLSHEDMDARASLIQYSDQEVLVFPTPPTPSSASINSR